MDFTKSKSGPPTPRETGPGRSRPEKPSFHPRRKWPPIYGLVPAGLRNDDRFRLLFITHATTAADSDQGISFDDSVVKAVSDSQGRWPFFRQSEGVVSTQRALVSTPGVDARVRTDTTFTATDKGSAHLLAAGQQGRRRLRGLLRRQTGTTSPAPRNSPCGAVVTVTTQPWTGSDNDGTELFAGTESLALGRTRVGIAGLGSTTAGHGPLSSGDVAATGMLRPLFGLTHVYVVRDDRFLLSNMAQTDAKAATSAPPGGPSGSPPGSTRAATRSTA